MPGTPLFEFVTYSVDTHGAFVRSTFAAAALPEWHSVRDAKLAFDDRLAASNGRCLVAHLRGVPERFAGWAAANADGLIFCYVKDLPLVRRVGLARALVTALGFDSRPVPLLYWTPTAQAIAANSGGVYYARWKLDRKEAER